MNRHEDSAGDLYGRLPGHQFKTGYRRLPITKKRIERKDWGVVACQPVSPGHFHCIAHFGGDTGYQELQNRDLRRKLTCQSMELCFENFCDLFCPCYQFPEKFPDHYNNQKSVSGYIKEPEPEGYINRFYAVICQKNRFFGNKNKNAAGIFEKTG